MHFHSIYAHIPNASPQLLISPLHQESKCNKTEFSIGEVPNGTEFPFLLFTSGEIADGWLQRAHIIFNPHTQQKEVARIFFH